MNKNTGDRMERLTIQQYATKLQPVSTVGYGGKAVTKKISISKAEVRVYNNDIDA